MEQYKILLDLRRMLHSMEHDLGFDDLSSSEVEVLLVARSLTRKVGDVVTSKEIRSHEMIEPLAPATYHRALRALLDRGLLFKAKGAKTKSYVVKLD